MSFANVCRTASKRTRIPAYVLRKGTKAVLEVVREEIDEKGWCLIPGVGSFRLCTHKPRRVQMHGESYELPAQKKVKFKQAKGWR